ncbi:MAG: glycosyltransferase [Paludibacteraceae bacterium]|nr:glycosyltransferase [Paludibacteraceae bacterium]MBR5824617.1 glycosyltransferase [Paludibacteraceae bacterium]
MNILITNIDGNPQFIGGVKRVSAILARQWIKCGCDVRFLCYTAGSDMRFDEVEGIKQDFLPNDNVIDCEENFEFFVNYIRKQNIDIVINQFVDYVDMTRLCVKVKESTDVKLISTLHFSVSHLNDIAKEMFFVKYRLGSNPVNYLRDVLLWGNYWLRNRKKIAKENRQKLLEAYQCSDKVMLLSENYMPLFEKVVGFKDEAHKLVAINNPSIQLDRIVREKEKRVLWGGRVEFGMKRVDRMMRIWKRVSHKFPDWQLDILGSGDIDFFRNLTKKYGIQNINFVGFCNPQEYYDRGAILCMTSSTEGWGMVLVEAQSNGVVPIAYNSYASATDIINDGENGFLVKAFDEDEYVKKLSLLIKDEQKRQEMSEQGLVKIKDFAVDKIAQKWLDLFNSL